MDDAQRQREAAALGMRLHSEEGPKEPQSVPASASGAATASGWKVYHQYIFTVVMGMSWPLPKSAFRGLVDGGMLPREREAAVCLNLLYPPQRHLEFLDINPNLEWYLNDRISEEGTLKDRSSPWRKTLPTQTGSAKIIMRQKSQEEVMWRIWEK